MVPLLTSLKTLNITLQTPLETLLGTPETLPTTEPSTPQISYTVADANLPSYNIMPYVKKHVAYLIGAGKFITAGTIYYRIKKNGASVYNGSVSVPANTYFTINGFFYDITVGDVLELSLWSSVTNSNWDYKAFSIMVTRLILMNRQRILKPCNFSAVTAYPALTLGNPAVYSTYAFYTYFDNDSLIKNLTSTFVFSVFSVGNTYGMFRVYMGDNLAAGGAIALTNATYRPYYYQNKVPTQIIMRGLKID